MYYDYLYWHCSAQLPVSGLPTTLCHAMRSVKQNKKHSAVTCLMFLTAIRSIQSNKLLCCCWHSAIYQVAWKAGAPPKAGPKCRGSIQFFRISSSLGFSQARVSFMFGLPWLEVTWGSQGAHKGLTGGSHWAHTGLTRGSQGAHTGLTRGSHWAHTGLTWPGSHNAVTV
jgi:hypothetical protein